MPYKSLAQQRYIRKHGEELGIDVAKWDEETGDKRLPERLGKTRLQKSKEKLKRGMSGKSI